ncbi:MAG: radical SAM protein [Lachnospiraceae bacterium]|jgi:MoaA/NifB/PqqE/SkfB family radical SAM enzyme
MADLAHAAERKVFETALNIAGNKAKKHTGEGYAGVVDAMQKVLKDGWKPEAYDRLRKGLSSGGKWQIFFDNLITQRDSDYLKGLVMSFGYEGALSGFRRTRAVKKKLNMPIPWVILFDPTSACNLHCTGCWAAEYKNTLNLSYEGMDSIVRQANDLGIHMFVLTGGEPLVRKKDVLRLAQEHPDNGYMIYTNGTLVDQAFIDEMKKSKNILLCLSIEGMEGATDMRRGNGVFRKVIKAMDLLRENGIVFGTSICYTSQNYKAVTSDEFLDFLIEKGAVVCWYFNFMPIGNDTTVDLLPTPEQREYMYHRLREIRGYTGGKPIFTMDFQNDGEFVSGCIAGGKYYCHINPNGDVEPCVFIHYSSANIHDMSLLDCLKQPLFKNYQAAQPFNENLLKPCPMLENPEILRRLVKQSGAHSTDMKSPEDVDHLCGKCDEYAKEWGPTADRLWKSNHPDYVIPKETEEQVEEQEAAIKAAAQTSGAAE